MATVQDHRIGKTIYADNIKLLKTKHRKTPSGALFDTSLQLLQKDYSSVITKLDKIDSDSVITPQEKQILKREWDVLNNLRSLTLQKADANKIVEQTIYANYMQAYADLNGIMDIILDPLQMDKDTDVSGLADLSDSFSAYYQQATLIDEYIYRLESGVLSGLDWRTKFEVTINATKNPLPLDGSSSTVSILIRRDGEEVTHEYDESDPNVTFRWVKLSEDSDSNADWMNAHPESTKTVTINKDDLVYGYASFGCVFTYYYAETMYVERTGFLSFSLEQAGKDGKDVLQVQVISHNGLTFRMENGDFSTVLEAKVWKGGEDVSHLYFDEDFRWKRVSNDTHSDNVWNSAHYSTGGKTITITQNDVEGRSNFFCDLLRERS